MGSVPGSLAGLMLRLALSRLGRKHIPVLLGTKRRAMLAGLIVGALLFYALSRRSVHDEVGDQMLGLQVGVFLAAVSCALAGTDSFSPPLLLRGYICSPYRCAAFRCPSARNSSVLRGARLCKRVHIPAVPALTQRRSRTSLPHAHSHRSL